MNLIKEENIFDSLKKMEIDPSILKGLHKLSILNPTEGQSKLISAFQNKKMFNTLISQFNSGKTVVSLTLLAHYMIQVRDKFQPNPDDENTNLYSCCICSSKDSTDKNMFLAQQLVKFCKKKNNLVCYNVNNDPDNISLQSNLDYILIGTPLNMTKFFQNLKVDQKFFQSFVFDELDYMLAFGYRQDLMNLQFVFQKQLKDKLVIITQGEEQDELKEFRKTLMPHREENLIQIEEQEQDEQQELKVNELNLKEYKMVSQYFSIGDSMNKYIIVYILFKLSFLAGKTLIIVKNNEEIYKMKLFLERIGVKAFSIYNSDDPKNLKYYTMTIFNTGVLQTLVATYQVIQDLQSKMFYSKKRKVLQFNNLNNIVLFDLKNVDYNRIHPLFRGSEGTVILTVQNDQDDIGKLTQIIENQRSIYSNQINIKDFPLQKSEIDAFRYRISDVVQNITLKQVKNAQTLDFKKKLLKSQDMAQYFEENPQERETILQEIIKLSQQIKKNAIKCDQDVPEYLVPQLILDQRKKNQVKLQNTTKKKILVKKAGHDQEYVNFQKFFYFYSKISKIIFQQFTYEKKLQKRVENNELTMDDVKKKRKIQQDEYVTIDEEKEQADETDPSRLKILSNRKLWKLKHGYSLKKRNRFLEKKGIFQ